MLFEMVERIQIRFMNPRKWVIRLWACVTVLLMLGCSKSNPNNDVVPYTQAKVTRSYKAITGVDTNLLSLDVYYRSPVSALKPVLVYVHGGAFALGDKANNMTNKVNWCQGLDYVLVSVNYRLSPAVYSTDPTRVMFPLHHEDVADAVRWIRDNITQYGGDPNRIGLMGHSAGAQLVALNGVSTQFLPARGIAITQLRGVACIDTEGYDVVARGQEGNEVYLNAFGQANTNWVAASPIFQVTAGSSYPSFFVAKRGTPTRIGFAQAFIDRLRSVGGEVSEITANQYDHEGINDAIGAPGESIITPALTAYWQSKMQ